MNGRLKAIGIKLGTNFLKIIPIKIAYFISDFLGEMSYFFLLKVRKIIEENISWILGDVSKSERERLTKNTFKNFARCMVDFLQIPFIGKDGVIRIIDFRLQELDRTLKKGRGAILVTIHLGNWDLAGVLLGALGYSVSAVTEDIPEAVYKVWEKYREWTGMKGIPLNEAGIGCYRALKKRELLVLLGDRDISDTGVEVRFCNGIRNIPRGPATLALKTGAPLLLGYIVRISNGNKKYLACVEPEIEIERRTGNFEDDVSLLTQKIANRLSELVRSHPDQWFVFQPDWRK